jgi:hypothetical protein
MKQFRKTKEDLFICEECYFIAKNIRSLYMHIRFKHKISLKFYYDKWIKEKDDDKCKICKKETKFISFISGYKIGCCAKHILKIHYGIENVFQLESVKEKCKQISIKKRGVDHPSKSLEVKNKKEETCLKIYGFKAGYADIEKREKTCLKNHGVKNPSQSEEIKKRKEETCLKNHGVKYPFQSEEIRKKSKKTKKEKYGDEYYRNPDKIKQTTLERYGVEHNMQNKDLFEKNQKSGFRLKQFRDTNLYYRGKYELDFLEKWYDIYPEIINVEPFEYIFEEKKHFYHPDFFIKSLNLMIEIKSSYYYKKYKKICNAKKKATITNGFNYIMIIDKDYNKFNLFI